MGPVPTAAPWPVGVGTSQAHTCSYGLKRSREPDGYEFEFTLASSSFPGIGGRFRRPPKLSAGLGSTLSDIDCTVDFKTLSGVPQNLALVRGAPQHNSVKRAARAGI